MISRLLTTEQLRALAASPDLEEALRLLMATAYETMATGLLERGATTEEVERAMSGNLVASYRRTVSIVGGRQGAVVEQMARRLELENLKTILRAKARGESVDAVRTLIVPMEELSDLPYDEMMRAEDLEAMARTLANTEFGPVLSAALPRYEAERTLFPVEVALDLHYYRKLWQVAQLLFGNDLRVARRIIGIRYDSLNIDWIVRYRLIYQLSPEEIFNYTLPHGWRVDNAVVRRAASGEGIEDVTSALPNPYRDLLSAVGSLPDPVERTGLILRRYLSAVARLSLAGHPFQIGVALAYMWLKEAELHDLRVVLEAKRYGFPVEMATDRFWRAA